MTTPNPRPRSRRARYLGRVPASRGAVRRLLLAAVLALATLPGRVLAHQNHEHADDGGLGLPAIVLGLGGALVVAGLAADLTDVDVPGQYAEGLVLGGAGLVLLVAPVLWLL